MTTKNIYAYCYANGTLMFSEDRVPEGALVIKRCPDGQDPLAFKKEMQGWCRLAYSGAYLVLGIPEAEDQFEALDALIRFVDLVNGKRPKAKRSRRAL